MRSMTLIFLLLFTFYAFVFSMDLPDVDTVRANRGRQACLPCGPRRLYLDGPEAYVLWVKNDHRIVYRLPYDEKSQRRVVNGDATDGISCPTSSCDRDTTLIIKNATDEDAGLYRCRVHYHGSPTVDYVMTLRIVATIPVAATTTGIPGKLTIYNSSGDVIKNRTAGPYSLGENVILTCEVKDHHPETTIYWRRNGETIKRVPSKGPNSMRVDLLLYNLTRNELDARFECVARNADVSEPDIAEVVIKMYLPPLSVEIRLNNNTNFETGQPRVVDCVVIGCVPSPIITWHIGDRNLRSNVHKELHDGNYTVSSLSLTASLRDHGNNLTCRAHNSYLSGKLFADTVSLNVGYRPVCQMGNVVVGIVARETETITCLVDASPAPLQFIWTFTNSKTMYTGATKVANYRHRYSSNLTWISQETEIGQLQCRASNSFGEQKQPCTYDIVAGGPPPTPDCKLNVVYPNALRASCKKSWDGGRTQTIHLKIVDEDNNVIRNSTDLTGRFFIPRVTDTRNLTAVLFSTNSRGSSPEVVVALQSLRTTAGNRNRFGSNDSEPYANVLSGTVAFCGACLVIAIVGKMLLTSMSSDESTYNSENDDQGSFHREPDIVRDDRVNGTTNITMNHLSTCQNRYTSTPIAPCRVPGHGLRSPPDSYPSSVHSFYV